ncbi:MAG TPA: transcriptional regulator NrdR [Planctomycetota bacterium]|nr:transcriptional regulator NrdR [Planctomycetota bacterium]
MKCPYCRTDKDRVVDSRSAEEASVIRRRRECLDCGRRYTTYERVEDIPLRVIKKDGSRVPFDRAKILMGLHKACEKRPIATETLEEIVRSIENDIYEHGDKEVSTKAIGELVMKKLRDLDQVAYVRFASVYREFKDPGQFLEELRPLLEKGGTDAQN